MVHSCKQKYGFRKCYANNGRVPVFRYVITRVILVMELQIVLICSNDLNFGIVFRNLDRKITRANQQCHRYAVRAQNRHGGYKPGLKIGI